MTNSWIQNWMWWGYSKVSEDWKWKFIELNSSLWPGQWVISAITDWLQGAESCWEGNKAQASSTICIFAWVLWAIMAQVTWACALRKAAQLHAVASHWIVEKDSWHQNWEIIQRSHQGVSKFEPTNSCFSLLTVLRLISGEERIVNNNKNSKMHKCQLCLILTSRFSHSLFPVRRDMARGLSSFTGLSNHASVKNDKYFLSSKGSQF